MQNAERKIYQLGEKPKKDYYTLFLYDQETKSWENFFASFDLEEVQFEVDEGEGYSRGLSKKQMRIMVFEDYDDHDYAEWLSNHLKELNSQSENSPTIYAEAHLDLVQYMLVHGLEVAVCYMEDGEVVEFNSDNVIEDKLEVTPKLVEKALDNVEGSYLVVKNGKRQIGSATIMTCLEPEETVADHSDCPEFDRWSAQYYSV